MKRLLVVGGAILVLAACDSATAPTISRHNGSAASVKKAPPTGTTQTSTALDGCGFWLVQGGTDSTWIPCDQ